MLGRQQIAGVPNAIHELFKNAHDAYADAVRVDYIHSLDLFLLRDDGLGMTRDDFEGKWLTLGTESKVGLNRADVPVWTGPDNRPRRPTMGEKGIGRLAIAAIGPQVLVLTKAVRPDGLGPLVAGFVNWSLFEQPGIDIDQIEVPILELPDQNLPTKSDIDGLVARVRANLESIREKIEASEFSRICRELDAFSFNPSPVYDALDGPVFSDRNGGTHFLIRPTNAELYLDLAVSSLADDVANPLQRFLLGFGNTMSARGAAPPIVAEFWEHRKDGSKEDLIGPYSFFTPDEFNSADHHIEGEFDEYGAFKGKVRIYDSVEHEYTLAPPDEIVGKTECGPFSLVFAYVQGAARDTRMPLDEWTRLTGKLDRIGGLYIYRDGVRILPYGNSDYDWLNIERRRSMAAKDWFFSYRRLFGSVELSHDCNDALVEKAGREGFRQNKAYRQMVLLLEELFKRLAFDFFRESAKFSTDFNEIKKIKQHEYKLLQNRAKNVSSIKKEFDASVERFFNDARSGNFEQECGAAAAAYDARLSLISQNPDAIAAGEQLLRLEAEFERTLKSLQERITVARPRAFGLNKRQKQDWEAYTRERARIIEGHLQPLAESVTARVRALVSSGQVSIDPRRRLDVPVKQESELALQAASEARKRAATALSNFEDEVKGTISRTWSELSAKVEGVKIDLARTEVASLPPEEIERRRDRLIGQIRESADHSTKLMAALSEQLSGIVQGLGDSTSLVDVTAALESENEDLKERVEQYTELAQVGLALGLVQHEFAGQVRNINRGLEALKPWADRNSGLDDLYRRLRVSFEHLESYLQLFVPLNRRLHRRRHPIAGAEIEEFVRTVFDPRFERHSVKLDVSPSFRRATIETFPSTLLPIFANIVDNAIFWLNQTRDQEKIIRFDVDRTGIIVENNGPGIDARDAERIFEFGVSNRSSGRGMGLYLARDGLRKEGMDIYLSRVGGNVEPQFRISVPDELLSLNA